MKKILFILVLTFFAFQVKAQVWAPSGATWYYEWAYFWSTGFVKIEKTGDTTILGKSCQILKKERYAFHVLEEVYDTTLIGYDYTCLENNVVYYFRFGQFYKLYDFNAMPGNSWVIAGWNNPPCDSTSDVMVDASGTLSINSFPLKYLKVSPGQNATWQFSDTLVERIGSFGYMFPEPTCIPDMFEGGTLRCYYDDLFGWYKRDTLSSCDFYYTGINNKTIPSEVITVSPNPSSSTLSVKINLPEKCMRNILFSDAMGKCTLTFKTDQKNFTVNVSDFTAGLYCLSVSDDNGNIFRSKIIINKP